MEYFFSVANKNLNYSSNKDWIGQWPSAKVIAFTISADEIALSLSSNDRLHYKYLLKILRFYISPRVITLLLFIVLSILRFYISPREITLLLSIVLSILRFYIRQREITLLLSAKNEITLPLSANEIAIPSIQNVAYCIHINHEMPWSCFKPTARTYYQNFLCLISSFSCW